MISRYEIFCKVMENGSFTKTAEELGYSQSAVSQAVRTLEQETETVLIDRKKDGIGLTADGEQYLPYFQQIYQAEKNLERRRRRRLSGRNGKCGGWKTVLSKSEPLPVSAVPSCQD